jgi:exonuclease SbcC
LATLCRDKTTRRTQHDDELAAVRGLAAAVHGDEPNTKRMRWETLVLAAQLEQVIAAANLLCRWRSA